MRVLGPGARAGANRALLRTRWVVRVAATPAPNREGRVRPQSVARCSGRPILRSLRLAADLAESRVEVIQTAEGADRVRVLRGRSVIANRDTLAGGETFDARRAFNLTGERDASRSKHKHENRSRNHK